MKLCTMITTDDYIISPFVKQEVMDSIKQVLISKGYQFVETLEHADFAIAYTIGARDMIKSQKQPSVLYGDWRWGHAILEQ